MIDILIDCSNGEIEVVREGIRYYNAKTNRNIASAVVIAWQIVHELSHDFADTDVNYTGVTPEGENKTTLVNIKTKAFCLFMDNFGSAEHLLLSQTNLGLQLLIHGLETAKESNESEKK